MGVALPDKDATKSRADGQLSARRYIKYLRTWFFCWECYLILLVAGFLRFYQLRAAEFDGDQAAIFGLAREAVRAGLWPIVSNRASIGIENPPAVIYILMIPAALSADPLLATIMVGLLNTMAVFLTYLFTRRYYGWLAGTIAALLYAAAAKPLNYSRFIWQQNMLALFVVLFMFALFWGVVERRKGWFFPAALLLGVAYQLHETSTLLVIPLLAALILAPGTLRRRDLLLAFISLLVIFSPYILWEFSTKFADVSLVLQVTNLRARIDGDALYLYEFFLSPNGFGFYSQVPGDSTSSLRQLGPMLAWLRYTLWLLVAGGLVTAGVLALRPRPGGASARDTQAGFFSPLRRWWADFRAAPSRCGLALLLIWQVAPVLLLSRHSLPLYPYYLLILMPGPFILMGVFSAKAIEWAARPELYWKGLRYGMYAAAALIVIAQIAACTATLLDTVDGTYKHGQVFNDLGSLQHALDEADQLALQRHLNMVYVTTDANTQTSLRYLAGQMRTPATLFDDERCLVLPGAGAGPAVLLASPYAQLTTALLREYASVVLVEQAPRLGASPFQLYIVTPKVVTGQTSVSNTFVNNLQLVNVQRRQLNAAGEAIWLVSHWKLLRSVRPGPRTAYNYALRAFTNTNSYPRRSLCTFTAIRPGDQLFVAFAIPNSLASAELVSIEGKFYTTTPDDPWFGFLHLETDQTQDSPALVLLTAGGKGSIVYPLKGDSHAYQQARPFSSNERGAYKGFYRDMI
jgi:Dolichyl-phosphate-mannose-protein mannosyltransferase